MHCRGSLRSIKKLPRVQYLSAMGVATHVITDYPPSPWARYAVNVASQMDFLVALLALWPACNVFGYLLVASTWANFMADPNNAEDFGDLIRLFFEKVVVRSEVLETTVFL
ncbi:MAG: hypothetical protein ACYCT0_06350 [Sulfobacillus sp.]